MDAKYDNFSKLIQTKKARALLTNSIVGSECEQTLGLNNIRYFFHKDDTAAKIRVFVEDIRHLK